MARWSEKDLKKKIHTEREKVAQNVSKTAQNAIQPSVGESKHICRSAHDQNGAFLLSFLELRGCLPEGATFEHSGDMECVIRWKNDEWKFEIQ